MDKTDKQLILKEIRAWRSSRLLPAEYCDFLANLYSEGEIELRENQRDRWKQIGHPLQIPWKSLIVSMLVSLLSLLFVLHFTSFPNWMQMGLLLVVVGIFYVLAFHFFFVVRTLRIVLLSGACLSAAWFAYTLAKSMDLLHSVGWSLTILVVVLLIWTLTGAIGNTRMITAAGWTGIAVLYEYALLYAKNIDWTSYGINNIYWAIFAAVSLVIGIVLARAKQYTAFVWVWSSLLALLIPEVLYMLSGAAPYFLLDAVAFLKVAVLVSLVIVFREEIQSWFIRLNHYKI